VGPSEQRKRGIGRSGSKKLAKAEQLKEMGGRAGKYHAWREKGKGKKSWTQRIMPD